MTHRMRPSRHLSPWSSVTRTHELLKFKKMTKFVFFLNLGGFRSEIELKLSAQLARLRRWAGQCAAAAEMNSPPCALCNWPCASNSWNWFCHSKLDWQRVGKEFTNLPIQNGLTKGWQRVHKFVNSLSTPCQSILAVQMDWLRVHKFVNAVAVQMDWLRVGKEFTNLWTLCQSILDGLICQRLGTTMRVCEFANPKWTG